MSVKTIRMQDVENVPADKVRPGDIIAEGIVLEVSVDQGYFLSTPYASVFADRFTTVQVYARLAPGMVEAVRETYENQRRGR